MRGIYNKKFILVLVLFSHYCTASNPDRMWKEVTADNSGKRRAEESCVNREKKSAKWPRYDPKYLKNVKKYGDEYYKKYYARNISKLRSDDELDSDYNPALDSDYNPALDSDYNPALDSDYNPALDNVGFEKVAPLQKKGPYNLRSKDKEKAEDSSCDDEYDSDGSKTDVITDSQREREEAAIALGEQKEKQDTAPAVEKNPAPDPVAEEKPVPAVEKNPAPTTAVGKEGDLGHPRQYMGFRYLINIISFAEEILGVGHATERSYSSDDSDDSYYSDDSDYSCGSPSDVNREYKQLTNKEKEIYFEEIKMGLSMNKKEKQEFGEAIKVKASAGIGKSTPYTNLSIVNAYRMILASPSMNELGDDEVYTCLLWYMYQSFNLGLNVGEEIERIKKDDETRAKAPVEYIDAQVEFERVLLLIRNELFPSILMSEKKSMLLSAVPGECWDDVMQWASRSAASGADAFINGLPEIILGLVEEFAKYEKLQAKLGEPAPEK